MAKRCPASALNQSLCRIVTLAMPRWAALRNASATASGITSTAITSQSGRSLASARAMAPVPVPRSRIRHAATGRRASACSTRHSVSGRGISVAGETNSGSDQNSAARPDGRLAPRAGVAAGAPPASSPRRRTASFRRRPGSSARPTGDVSQQDLGVASRTVALRQAGDCLLQPGLKGHHSCSDSAAS